VGGRDDAQAENHVLDHFGDEEVKVLVDRGRLGLDFGLRPWGRFEE
jgi:hypothetical protein